MWITRFLSQYPWVYLILLEDKKQGKYNPLHTSPEGGGFEFFPLLWGGLERGDYFKKYLKC